MAIADDRKRGQVLTSASRLAFTDSEMQKVLTTGFTIPRCAVEANRLIALGEVAQRKYDNRKNKDDEISDEDVAAVREGKKAKELLYLIEKAID